MTSHRQITDDMSPELQQQLAESSSRLRSMQEWARERCLELAELDQVYARLTAGLTQVEHDRLTEADITKLLEVAESLMSPEARQRLHTKSSTEDQDPPIAVCLRQYPRARPASMLPEE